MWVIVTLADLVWIGQRRSARQKRVLAHPEKIGLELVGGFDWMGRGRDDIAPAGIDFVFEHQSD